MPPSLFRLSVKVGLASTRAAAVHEGSFWVGPFWKESSRGYVGSFKAYGGPFRLSR
jgi:hypothetical protein